MFHRSSIRLLTSAAIVAALSSSCASTSWGGWGERDVKAVDQSLLAYVAEDERAGIMEARAETVRFEDEVAYAQSEQQIAKDRLDLVEAEMDVVDQDIERAKQRVQLARNQTTDELDSAKQDLDEVRERRRWVRARIDQQEQQVEAAQTKVDLKQLELQLAEAKVELRKAKAVSDLERPQADKIAVEQYVDRVDRLEADVADMRVDLEAAKQKAENRIKTVEQRSESVPSQYLDEAERHQS